MCLFFVSSRRRHTRWPRDWSSDVCSSDLERADKELQRQRGEELDRVEARFELTKNPLRKLISIRQSQLVGMIEFRRLIRTQWKGLHRPEGDFRRFLLLTQLLDQ